MEHLGLRYRAYQTHAGVKAAVTVLGRALAGGLELSIAGGTPVAASRGYKRGRRTNAAPSRGRLVAWPTLGKAAEMIGRPASTLTRAADACDIAKYPFGRRDKKLAPDTVLELAVVYAVDVNEVADQLMAYAEASSASSQHVASVEESIGTWLARQAQQAGSGDDDLEALVAAIREVAAPEVAEAILARAGVTA